MFSTSPFFWEISDDAKTDMRKQLSSTSVLIYLYCKNEWNIFSVLLKETQVPPLVCVPQLENHSDKALLYEVMFVIST